MGQYRPLFMETTKVLLISKEYFRILFCHIYITATWNANVYDSIYNWSSMILFPFKMLFSRFIKAEVLAIAVYFVKVQETELS